MPFIISTLSTPVEYTIYSSNLAAAGTNPTLNRVIEKVVIDGYANMANKHFITEKCCLTEVTDEQVELLRKHPVFQMHVDNGFMKIVESKVEDTSNMEAADQSAPLTPEKFTKQAEEANASGFHRNKRPPRSKKEA